MNTEASQENVLPATERFGRLDRLIGRSTREQLSEKLIVIVGLGGVGGFAAESLARSGFAHLRLVDFDTVAASNCNRQLCALQSTVGQLKVDVVAQRIRDINPDCNLEVLPIKCCAETMDQVLANNPAYVVDAIDLITHKCELLATCHARGIPVVTSLGAAGRLDPTRVKIADLNKTEGDALGAHVRKILRQKHGFPRGTGKFGIPAVYSDEAVLPPYHTNAPRAFAPVGDDSGDRSRTSGSASFVTGTFGLTCASIVFKALYEQESQDKEKLKNFQEL